MLLTARMKQLLQIHLQVRPLQMHRHVNQVRFSDVKSDLLKFMIY